VKRVLRVRTGRPHPAVLARAGDFCVLAGRYPRYRLKKATQRVHASAAASAP